METQTTVLLTLRELHRRLRRFGITLAWLRDEAEAGRLPCLRVRNKFLFSLPAVETALAMRAAEKAVSQ